LADVAWRARCWRAEFEAELMTFPAGKHDDQVDALSLVRQFLDIMTPGQRPKPPEPPRDSWDIAFEGPASAVTSEIVASGVRVTVGLSADCLCRNPVGKVPSATRRNPLISLPRKSMQKPVDFGMEQWYCRRWRMPERMMGKGKRAAIYLRVSTGEQTVDNQRRELEAAAASRGWSVVAVYADEGISGAKGREGRPQLDLMLKDAVRRRFDVAMVWSVDRLGRSLADLIGSMQEFRDAKVDLFIHQQGLDTTTASGRAMFGMLGVFSEFERAMIQARVKAGLERAKQEQMAGKVRRDARGRRLKAIGRPRVSSATEAAIRERLAAGVGMLTIAAQLGVGSGTVQRVKRELVTDADPNLPRRPADGAAPAGGDFRPAFSFCKMSLPRENHRTHANDCLH
jgi:DNA invertase Pin-like site-specific DNA recombinase